MSFHWLVSAMLCLLSFGLWGFFSRLALDHIAPMQMIAFQTVGIVLVTILLFKNNVTAEGLNLVGSAYAVMTGVAFCVGSILFFVATTQQGKISVVVTLTALYPLVTIILACILLKESINLQQWLGMGLAVCSMLILSYS